MQKRPVVALESTLIAHGLPWPQNFETACEIEAEVRGRGAVPATIAVVAGVPTVGVDAAMLEAMARSPGQWKKANAADLAVCITERLSAATTVSATAFIAARAGIRLFATGGIGGVHRGDSGDVSSDLTTLSQTLIAVVTAGAKAILDLPRTLEMLETLGVLVVGVGTKEFPAFYSAKSGLALEHRVDGAAAAAKLCATRFSLGQAAVLLCNPIPSEHALDATLVENAIAQAIAKAQGARIQGKALTPFLLTELAQITGNKSLAANRALIVHNACFAAETALALAALQP